MFDAIKFVYTPLALAAFIVAAVTMILRARQQKERRLIELAPEQDRGRLVERVLEGLNLAEEGLTKAQRYQLAENLLRERANRFTVVTFASLVIAVVVAAVVIVSMVQPSRAAGAGGPDVAELQTRVAHLERENDELRATKAKLQSEADTLHKERDARKDDAERLATTFLTHPVLRATAASIIEDKPDGIRTADDAIASLVWQLRAQDGFAEFLAADKAHRVHVKYGADNGVDFDWETGSSSVVRILDGAGVTATPTLIRRLNTGINRVGVAWLDDGRSIVRTADGGLALVVPEK